MARRRIVLAPLVPSQTARETDGLGPKISGGLRLFLLEKVRKTVSSIVVKSSVAGRSGRSRPRSVMSMMRQPMTKTERDGPFEAKNVLVRERLHSAMGPGYTTPRSRPYWAHGNRQFSSPRPNHSSGRSSGIPYLIMR